LTRFLQEREVIAEALGRDAAGAPMQQLPIGLQYQIRRHGRDGKLLSNAGMFRSIDSNHNEVGIEMRSDVRLRKDFERHLLRRLTIIADEMEKQGPLFAFGTLECGVEIGFPTHAGWRRTDSLSESGGRQTTDESDTCQSDKRTKAAV
jgi:hypothetical protein